MRFIPILIAFTVVIFFTRCSSGPTVTARTAVTAPSSEDPVALYETDMIALREKNVNILAPDTFNQAMAALTEARDQARKLKLAPEIEATVAAGREWLRKATLISTVTGGILQDALATRYATRVAIKDAKTVKATGLEKIEEEYADTEEAFLKIARTIERNQTQDVTADKREVARQFAAVEVLALKKWGLDEVRRLMDKAIAAGARKYAPQSLAATELNYSSAATFIAEHPKERAQIQKRVEEVLFLMRRLIHLTEEAKLFSNKTLEEVSLYVEKKLSEIGLLLAGDARDRDFEEQLTWIQGAIEALKMNDRGLAEEAQKLRSNVASLYVEVERKQNEVRKAQLAVQKAQPFVELDERYEKVRAQFAPDEAEVFRDASKLIIRLRTIKFPIGQAVLMTESYPLLTKVQKAIKVFGNPRVTVEGHTDSVGSAKANQKLSLQRADAVKQYLVANNTIAHEDVLIAGFGFQRPLTTERTPEGRAINRRIDIVIESK